MALKKIDLVNQIYKTHDLTKTQASEALEKFFEILKNCLENGQDLLL